jgi:hypothetical protein
LPADSEQNDMIRGNLETVPLRHLLDQVPEYRVVGFLVIPAESADQVVVRFPTVHLVIGLAVACGDILIRLVCCLDQAGAGC